MICSGRIKGAEIRAHAPQKLSACFSKGEPVCTAVRQRGNVVKPDGRAAKEPEHGGQGRLARIYFEVISKVGGA